MSIKSEYTNIYCTSKRNAAKRGIEFRLTRAEFDRLVHSSNGRCAVSGIPFDFRRFGQCSRRPFAPSLDRIHSARGYTARNCRIVCVLANLALNEWGVEPLLRLAQNLIAQQDQLRQHGPPGFVTVGDYLKETGTVADAGRVGSLSARLCHARSIERALIQRPGAPVKAAYPRAIIADAVARLSAP